MGFPNPGAAAVAGALSMRTGRTIVGVNIGKTKFTPADAIVADYQASALRLSPVADYVVLNVSSPNTPGLLDVQAADRLAVLIAETRNELRARDRLGPLLVKIGPDLTDPEIDAIADLAVEFRLEGLIACNTTVTREGLRTDRSMIASIGEGGVSGAPLKPRAVEVLERLYSRVGDSVLLISVGGVETVEDAWERILAGATLIQAYTAFVYEGPLWPSRLNRGLARRARKAGVSSIQELVGTGREHP
jgi:dihydroorotate dehydrogenase